MPLLKSASDKAVGENIKRETEAGRPRKQAIAIALETQRRAGGGKKRKHPAKKVYPHLKSEGD